MAMHIDTATGGLSFETISDMPEALFKAPNILVNAKFILPKEVDLHFILSPHATDKDFELVIPSLRRCDVYLTEFAEPDIHAMQFAQELSKGNRSVYKRYKKIISKTEPTEINTWCDAMFDSIYAYRPKVALFDAPIGHKVYEPQDSYAKRFAELADNEPLENLTAPSFNELINRDKWCLKNMKSIVDFLQPYKKGIRRQVLITRGTYHVGLANALETVCDTDDIRACGSAVVSTMVVVRSNGEDNLNYFYTNRLANN